MGRALPLYGQNPWPRLLALCAYLRDDVVNGGSAVRTHPPMRRHPRIALGPQLAIDGGLVRSALPKDESIGRQGVQNGHSRHPDIVSAVNAQPPYGRGPRIEKRGLGERVGISLEERTRHPRIRKPTHMSDDITRPEALERGLEERVLALWGSVLGVEAGLLDRDGLVAVEDHRDFAARRRATIRTARGTFLLAAPAEEPVAVADPASYSSDVAARAQAVGLLHYLAGPPAGDRDPRVRVLGAVDRPLLDALQEAAGAAASEEAEVDVEHPLAVGIAEGGRLLAVASLLDESKDAVDVGVLVDPVERRRRLGAAVVRDIADRAARSGRLVQYRCNRENEASARLARACGFTLWGVLTIAPQPD